MEEQIKNAIDFIKNQNFKGCISGSCMIGYWEGQDVDVFLYSKSAFIKAYYTLKFNSLCVIDDPIHQWSSDNLEEDIDRQFKKRDVVSIKFIYNTCVPINLVWKYGGDSLFNVLESFDINIICKGFDLETKQYLDLTGDSLITKIADWNRYNTKYNKKDIWSLNSILRQFKRQIKYHERGFNMDLVVLKYIDIINSIQKIENIFKNSEKYKEILNTSKNNTMLLKKVLENWLENHSISEEEIELIDKKMKEI